MVTDNVALEGPHVRSDVRLLKELHAESGGHGK